MTNTNGRINLIQPDTGTLFKLYDKVSTKQISFKNPTTGIFDNSVLIDVFFSASNITSIQKGIQEGVYRASGNKYRVGFQDEDTLCIIMRSIFLQYSKNLPNDTRSQVETLNSRVLDYCIKQVYSEAQGYMKYLTDVSSMYTPMDRPIMADYDDKTLELKKWF
jgi:hypothetical protein